MFQHCPLLSPYANQVDEIIAKFLDYKTRVPGYGAIILNPSLEKCLLVKGCGFRPCWGFPKGKINQNESEKDCAIREVYEETGFNLHGLIKEDDYIEQKLRDQVIKLYIVPFIPEDKEFHPRTKNEIGGIQWHEISDIPISYSELKDRGKYAINYYSAIPFLPKLKRWIERKKHIMKKQGRNLLPIAISSRVSGPLNAEGLQYFSPVKQTPTSSRSQNIRKEDLSILKQHTLHSITKVQPEQYKINPLLTFKLSTDRLLDCLSLV